MIQIAQPEGKNGEPPQQTVDPQQELAEASSRLILDWRKLVWGGMFSAFTYRNCFDTPGERQVLMQRLVIDCNTEPQELQAFASVFRQQAQQCIAGMEAKGFETPEDAGAALDKAFDDASKSVCEQMRVILEENSDEKLSAEQQIPVTVAC